MKDKENLKIRQPIVTVVGHVDHGKTTLLDRFRGSCIQEKEAGNITQKISFTLYPLSKMKEACPLIDSSGIKVSIPGFLFIDTPGHAAFTNLRKRGGSLADLAILVIDINEGIKPQTAEVLQILKHNKTPFIIALNKIDNISGWRKLDEDLKKSIELQPQNVKQIFMERYMTIMGALNSYGFDSGLYYEISDFTRKIALVPISAAKGEGIPELMLVLCGLSQKYLGESLKLGEDARGVILEVKKDQSGSYSECILYDGEIKKGEEIAISSLEGEPIITKIRVLEEVLPLCESFVPRESAKASTGLRMQFVTKEEILPGMPFVKFDGNLEKLREEFKKEVGENIRVEKQGIIAKADSLGSLEALLYLLRQHNIPVVKAGIGDITKTDIISAKANLDINELDAVVVGFNVGIKEDAKEFGIPKEIEIITEEVVYKLIERLVEFRIERKKEIEKKRLMGLATICKLKVLHQYVFRNTNPAVFGVLIESGKLKSDLNLIDEHGEKVGKIKSIQSNNKPVEEELEGKEVAVSISGINFERRMKNVNYLYSDISENQFRNFKKNKDLLSQSEIKTLQEIAEIKRRKRDEWGA